MGVLQPVESHSSKNGKDLDISALEMQRSPRKGNLSNGVRVILHGNAVRFVPPPLQEQLQRQ